MKHLKAIGEKVDFAIDVEVPDENIVRQNGWKKSLCMDVEQHIMLYIHPTKVEGTCDTCGEELIVRDDDKPETVLEQT